MKAKKLRELAGQMTKHDMVYLMLEWAKTNPLPREWDNAEDATSEKALDILCIDALYASGKDDCCGCILCQS